MSGRKSWEVASVLNEVEKVYDEIVDSYKSEIDENLSIVDEIKSKSKEAKEKIDKIDDADLKKELSSFEEWFTSVDEIKQDVQGIFNSIANNKVRANSLREKIRNSSHYMDREYDEAQTIKREFNLSKEELLRLRNSSIELKHNAKKLEATLENIDDVYRAKRDFLNQLFNSINDRYLKNDFVKLEDSVEDRDIYINCCEYFDHYKNQNSNKEIKQALERAKELLDNEEFVKAEQELNTINSRLNQISAEAYKLKEDIESSYELADKIRNLMVDEIDFRKAVLELIDDNPANGFKLICKNGDTIIFDEIKVDDGEVKVELDHIEGVGGSCRVRWKDMKKVLNQNGIPLTDVKKDGKSVVYNKQFIDRRADKMERSR